METSTIVERDFTALGMLFNLVINDMKNGTPAWEDFIIKATKLHTQLKSTVLASTAFLDSFQKIADMATSTRGGTKDIGSALTRMCLRQRSVESHLKTFTSSIMDCLIIPLQDRLEEWKKTNTQLDKEHSKEYKKFRQELKKKSDCGVSNTKESGIYQSQQSIATLKLQKKLRILNSSNNNLYNTNEPIYSQMDLNDKLIHFEQMEKNAVRRALIEERSRYCLFVNYLKNVVEEELLITQETSHLQEVMESLNTLTKDPYTLPVASELVITDLKLGGNASLQLANTSSIYCNSLNMTNETNNIQKFKHHNQHHPHSTLYTHLNHQTSNQPSNQASHNHNFHTGKPTLNLNQTPPSSPSSFSSRKSSMCSISSFNSSSSGSTHSHSSLNHHHHLPGLHDVHSKQTNSVSSRFNSLSQMNCGLPPRIPSIASHDSGFMSNADYSLPQVSCLSEHSSNTSSTSSMPSNNNCWSNNNTSSNVTNENPYTSTSTTSSRPHTISGVYEQKQTGHHNRPSITLDTFEPIYNSSSININNDCTSQVNQSILSNQKEHLYSKKITGHSTVIKVETTSSIPKTVSLSTVNNSIQTDEQKCFDNIKNMNSSNQNLHKTSPPTPPTRKFSLQSDYQTSNDNICSKNTKQQNIQTFSCSNENNTICSEGSITPTNVNQLDQNFTTSIETNQNSTKLKIIDDGTVTLTRHNCSTNQNNLNKLSSSLKSVLLTNEDQNNKKSQLNGQLSLTNLNNQNIAFINKTKSIPPPPPIRRTSSISNPNAITLGTLRSAGVSTYEEIKNLTSLNRLKKNTTNYATYEDVSRLGMSLIKNLNSSDVPNSNMTSSNLNIQKINHYGTYSFTSNNYLNGQQSNSYYDTYTNSNCFQHENYDNSKYNENVYSKLDDNKSNNHDEKEKTIHQLRSEYQQAKHLFENLQSNQYQPKNENSTLSLPSNVTEFNSSSFNQNIENNNLHNGSHHHVSRMSTIKKEFIETLNAKLSSPNVKTSPKINKRRSLSVGPDVEYDFDSNSGFSRSSSNNQNNKSSNETSTNTSNHFSFQQSLMKLVTTNYAKITRSPELNRKQPTVTSNNYHNHNRDSVSSLISTNSNSSLILTSNTTSTNNAVNNLRAEVAKEVASIAIKKKQNSYPVACGNYEILDINKKKGPIYSSSNMVTNGSIHTTTIQVEASDLNINSSSGQEIYQPVHNLQIMSSKNQHSNLSNISNQKRCSQPNMGVKIVTNMKQQNQQQQKNCMYYTQTESQTENYQLTCTSNNQPFSSEIPKLNSFKQNLDSKINFLNKLDSKLSSNNNNRLVDKCPTLDVNKENRCFENAITARVENWLKKSPVDQAVSRENLMDQIRKGTQLRKVNIRNDRSNPKI